MFSVHHHLQLKSQNVFEVILPDCYNDLIHAIRDAIQFWNYEPSPAEGSKDTAGVTAQHWNELWLPYLLPLPLRIHGTPGRVQESSRNLQALSGRKAEEYGNWKQGWVTVMFRNDLQIAFSWRLLGDSLTVQQYITSWNSVLSRKLKLFAKWPHKVE